MPIPYTPATHHHLRRASKPPIARLYSQGIRSKQTAANCIQSPKPKKKKKKREIQKIFVWDLNDERAYYDLMQRIGKLWKDHKSTVWKSYLQGEYETPFVAYPSIRPEEWVEFKAMRETCEAKERREKAKKSTSSRFCAHILPRGGFRVGVEKMKKIELEKKKQLQAEGKDASSLTVNDIDDPNRMRMWLFSKKSDKTGEYICEEIKKMANNADGLKEQASQGIIKEMPNNDLLVHLSGTPDHDGRLRGLPMGITMKHYWPEITQYRQSANTATSSAQMEQIARKTFDNMWQEKLDTFFKSTGCDKTQDLSTQIVRLSLVQDVFGCPTPPSDDEDQETPCVLNVMLGDTKMVVAEASVTQHRTLQGKEVEEGIIIVRMIKAIQAAAQLPILVDGHTHVFQSIGTYVPWPEHLCDVEVIRSVNSDHPLLKAPESLSPQSLVTPAQPTNWGGRFLNKLAKFSLTLQ